MDPLKFAELKRLVFEEAKFGPIWDYFMDHFGENEAFLKLGRGADFTPQLKVVIQQVAAHVLHRPPALVLSHWRLIEVPDLKFTHGAGLVNGKMSSLFHFDDEDVGMFSICPGGSETQMARFSTKLAPVPKREPSKN